MELKRFQSKRLNGRYFWLGLESGVKNNEPVFTPNEIELLKNLNETLTDDQLSMFFETKLKIPGITLHQIVADNKIVKPVSDYSKKARVDNVKSHVSAIKEAIARARPHEQPKPVTSEPSKS